MIDYESFIESCPNVVNGLARCDQGSSHISNDTTATLTINFYGRAIYLFGSVTGGTQYTTALDSQDSVNGTTVGDLLASYENLQSPSAGETHQITLTATQFTADGDLSFTKAIVSVGTGLQGATAAFTTFKAVGDASSPIKFTRGWTTNGTYMQSGTQFSQTATLNFTGSAVLVHGLCSPFRDNTGYQNSYGSVTVDGGEEVFIEDDTTLFFSLPNSVEDDCLLYYNTGLNDGEHQLAYQTNDEDVFISSMDVLGVSGGTTAGNGTNGDGDGPGGLPGNSTQGSDGVGGTIASIQLSLGVIIAIVTGAVILCLVCGVLVWACLIKRRRRRQNRHLGAPIPYHPKPNEQPLSYAALASQVSLRNQHSQYPPPPIPPPLQIRSYNGPVALDDPPAGYTATRPAVQSTPVNSMPSDAATYGSANLYPRQDQEAYDAAQSHPPGLQLNVLAAPRTMENLPPKVREEMRWAMQNASTPYTAATPANYYDPRRDPNFGPLAYADGSMAAGSSTNIVQPQPQSQSTQMTTGSTTASAFNSRPSVRRLTQQLFEQGNGATDADEAPPPDYSQATS